MNRNMDTIWARTKTSDCQNHLHGGEYNVKESKMKNQ